MKVLWVKYSTDKTTIFTLKTWKSWLHVRSSTVLACNLSKLHKKYNIPFKILINNIEIEGVMSVLSLWIWTNQEFELVLDGENLNKHLINDVTNTLNGLENHNIAWSQSVSNAIKDILWY